MLHLSTPSWDCRHHYQLQWLVHPTLKTFGVESFGVSARPRHCAAGLGVHSGGGAPGPRTDRARRPHRGGGTSHAQPVMRTLALPRQARLPRLGVRRRSVPRVRARSTGLPSPADLCQETPAPRPGAIRRIPTSSWRRGPSGNTPSLPLPAPGRLLAGRPLATTWVRQGPPCPQIDGHHCVGGPSHHHGDQHDTRFEHRKCRFDIRCGESAKVLLPSGLCDGPDRVWLIAPMRRCHPQMAQEARPLLNPDARTSRVHRQGMRNTGDGRQGVLGNEWAQRGSRRPAVCHCAHACAQLYLCTTSI